MNAASGPDPAASRYHHSNDRVPERAGRLRARAGSKLAVVPRPVSFHPARHPRQGTNGTIPNCSLLSKVDDGKNYSSSLRVRLLCCHCGRSRRPSRYVSTVCAGATKRTARSWTPGHGLRAPDRAIELADPNDRHVAAVAIHARADAIVTFNLCDFPATALKRYRLEAIHPDDFIQYQFDLNNAAVLIAARAYRQRLVAPPKTPEENAEILRSQSLPKSADELMPYISII